MPSFHRCGNNLYTTLAANVAAIDTTIDVAASGLDDLPVPFLADLGGEIVEVTLVTEDTPAPGTTRWTVTRAVYGAAGVYTAGIPVAQRNYAEQFNELQDFNVAAWLGVVSTLGADTGVIGAPDESGLDVTAGAGVTVDVTAGVCVVDSWPVFYAGGTLALDLPPSGSVNYQVLIDATGTLSANEETAGQPAPAGYAILADVTVESTDTGLDPADVTDRRVLV